MTKWFHKCDLDWLRERQKYLTATDVKELLPFTKSGRKKTIIDENYLKILARKSVGLTESDCISTGATARGHILEPYAIECCNNTELYPHLYHWDDLIITKANHPHFGLAFSPDATNRPMPYDVRRLDKHRFEDDGTISMIGEVKSYSPEHHMIAGYTNKMDLEERWQIAVAMTVCPSIEEAVLMFYNPSMRNQMYLVEYDRTDLKNEIDTVINIEQDWLGWLGNLSKLDHSHVVSGINTKEQMIINKIIKMEELNPEGEKSIIQ